VKSTGSVVHCKLGHVVWTATFSIRFRLQCEILYQGTFSGFIGKFYLNKCVVLLYFEEILVDKLV